MGGNWEFSTDGEPHSAAELNEVDRASMQVADPETLTKTFHVDVMARDEAHARRLHEDLVALGLQARVEVRRLVRTGSKITTEREVLRSG